MRSTSFSSRGYSEPHPRHLTAVRDTSSRVFRLHRGQTSLTLLNMSFCSSMYLPCRDIDLPPAGARSQRHRMRSRLFLIVRVQIGRSKMTDSGNDDDTAGRSAGLARREWPYAVEYENRSQFELRLVYILMPVCSCPDRFFCRAGVCAAEASLFRSRAGQLFPAGRSGEDHEKLIRARV